MPPENFQATPAMIASVADQVRLAYAQGSQRWVHVRTAEHPLALCRCTDFDPASMILLTDDEVRAVDLGPVAEIVELGEG